MSSTAATPAGVSHRTRGWTRSDYADAGVPGQGAARRFRNVHLPPVTAGLLRQCGYTIDGIESMARQVPSWALHQWAASGWLDGASVFQVVSAGNLGIAAADAWTSVPRSALVDALFFIRVEVDHRKVANWVHMFQSTAAVLRQRLAVPARPAPGTHVARALAADPNAWLDVAVRDVAQRKGFGWRPPALAEDDPGIGGLTGLWAAAGTTPPVALAEAATGMTGEDIEGLHLVAVLNCPDPVPPLDWWLTR